MLITYTCVCISDIKIWTAGYNHGWMTLNHSSITFVSNDKYSF